MTLISFPSSQRELLIAARGQETQAAFARRLGINRSSLSRYESEQLGIPTAVLNVCLVCISAQLQSGSNPAIQQALRLVRQATQTLERVANKEASGR
ncbi:hypothetical protein SAMN05216570_1021 [Dyella sp. OK004]|nr:hypothetical protein SAMN05216570_1021 [Dyella sp. OK004]